MTAVEKPVISVAVRDLVAFVLRRGDLGGEGEFVGPRRALAGLRGHQQLQRSRPAGYQKEVRVAHEVDAGEFRLRIQGRIDGVLATTQPVLLEEIKTVQAGWAGEADPLHWAQLRFYGYIYAQEHGLDRVGLQLSYLDLGTGKTGELRQEVAYTELESFFQETTAVYVEWVRERQQWRRLRDQTIQALGFAFPNYRAGQRQLAVAAYRALSRGGRLFLEAPTGIGKTISVLFPAVKALGEGKLVRIFYLTARTPGRAAAEKALKNLRANGLRLCSLSLTAKEKLCVQAGQACDPAVCPLARGYYDRLKPAMREALQREEITRPVLEAVAQQHQVCPFELSLDLSSWVDAVICDYNYVFDPQVYLRRHFGDEGGEYAFLVDEAHNLVDRGREMFSAELDPRQLQEVRSLIKDEVPRCARALGRLNSAMRKLGTGPSADEPETPEEALELALFQPASHAASAGPRPSSGADTGALALAAAGSEAGRTQEVSAPGAGRGPAELARREFPAELGSLLEKALEEAEAWLVQNEPAQFRQALLELYFSLLRFARTAELYDERYVTLIQAGAGVRVRLFCVDPSCLLRQALGRGKAAVFFSATLTPLEYYRELLGGSPEDPALQLPSPFPPENLAVLVHDQLRTDFKTRGSTLPEVAQAVGTLVEARPGNYLVYFPSYQYLQAVREQFQALYPSIALRVQQPRMSEAEREAFLVAFEADHNRALVGFAVMGGIFGEGIDLVGERLIGAVIVGVGLPQVCLERDTIRAYFQARTGTGFEYAYVYPGMNRVLQASGRVIRSEVERGVVLLLDARFGERRYRALFPPWWQPVTVRDVSQLQESLRSKV